jgi:hypothetical protein
MKINVKKENVDELIFFMGTIRINMCIGTCNLDTTEKMLIDHPFDYIHIMNMAQITVPFLKNDFIRK